MQQSTYLGMNKTGAQMSPMATKSMQSYADENSPFIEDPMEEQAISSVRSEYAHEADKVGSVPLPGTLTGAVSTGLSKLAGKNPEVLIDKLGERLAYERTGVRLYQTMIDKVSAMTDIATLPFGIGDLEHIRDEELEHMHMLAEIVESLGADPTAQTPCADTIAVASGGVMQVLSDPRTSIPQCLVALLSAELTDDAGWELLIQVAKATGQPDKMLRRLKKAEKEEGEHIDRVQDWLNRLVVGEATA